MPASVTETRKLLSLEDVAEALSISIHMVRKWVAAGRIRSCKLGTRRLVPATEVDRLIQESINEKSQP
jgi:excisionase family DNA binding protein